MAWEWLARLRAAELDYGVRRVSSVTQLDRIGIPVAVAVRGDAFPESSSVTSGAGLSEEEAQLSALAEALERWSAEPRGHVHVAPHPGEGLRIGAAELIPADAHIAVMSWCQARSFDGEEPVSVPAAAVFFPYDEPAPFAPSTNGLAFGTTRAGAQRSGLLECIERDAFSRAMCLRLGGALLPCPRINRTALPREASALAAQITEAGLELCLRDVTGDIPVPTVLCTLWERFADGRVWAHLGLACRPSAAEAAIDAMLEAAQSRLVEIQGAREDLAGSLGPAVEPWFLGEGGEDGRLAEDAADDLGALVQLVRAAGLPAPVWVDLSAPGRPGVVVRVILPGAELCAVDPERVGARAERWTNLR